MQHSQLLPKTNLGLVTDKALAKANIDHHFRGWCSFEGLVLDDARQELLEEAIASEYVNIFNRLGKKDLHKDTRSSSKAGARGEQVLADIVRILRKGLIIGDEHVDGLGRGGSYLRTLPGCVMQTQHLDFDFVALSRPGRRCATPCQHP
jgi:hypothetical protein